MKYILFFLFLAVLSTGCVSNYVEPKLSSTGLVNTSISSNDTVQTGDTVSVDYTGMFQNGSVFDTSEGREPLEFVVGAGQLIKGFDSGVVGMKISEEKTITIKPEDAYGQPNPTLIRNVSIDELKNASIKPEVGMTLYNLGQPVKIIKVDANNVTIDFNHPLAGQTLVFKIKVVDIKRS